MNEDLLKHLFEKYQLSSVGTFDEFKNDMSSVDVRKSFFNNHELSKVGTFEEFENDLGANNISSLTAHQKALLDTISDVESPDYNVITGGRRFQGYDQHPNIVGVVTPAGPSTAAGKYQITKSTWDRIQAKLHLPDFSPESQDKAAIWLAQDDYRRRTNRELDEDLQSNDPNVLENIRKTLSPTWEGLAKDKSFVNRYQPRVQGLIESMGSASDPIGPIGVNFAEDVDQTKFDQKTLDELYVKAGGKPGEAYEADIKHDDDTFLGMFKTNRYNLSFKDKQGVKSTKYLDRNNAGIIDRFDAALVNVGVQVVSGLASLAGAAVGVTEDAVEAVLTGDTNFDKTMDYADNAVNDWLNTNKSKQITNDSMLAIEERARIAEENKGAFAGFVASLSKLGESQYWEQEGADMLGSQLAFSGLGLAASGAIQGTKLGIGLTKVLTKIPLVSEKVAEKIVALGAGSVLNSSAESVQEAGTAYKEIKQALLDKGLTEEESTKQAADAASEIFGTNFMMLLATNFIELKGLTDGISTSKHALIRGVINTLIQGVSEGVQESFQTGATDYSKDKALNQPYNEGKNTGVFDSIFGDGENALGGTLKATYNGLMDGKAEYWDSAVGGFGMATTSGAPTSIRSIHQLYTKEKPIMSKVNSSLALSANDIYKTDENGKLIYDSNNKPQIDPTKQLSAIRGMNTALQIDQLQEEALKNNNAEAVKVLQATKISSIIHDHLSKGDNIEAIENAINNSMTKKDYEQNKLSEFYSYEEFKDIKKNILDIAKDNYSVIYSNPLLKNNSAEFKQSIYHNSVQQDLVTKELDKYTDQLEDLNNKKEKLNSLQKEEKKILEAKVESLKTYKLELVKVYDKLTSNKTADTKITEEETNAQEVAKDFKNGKTEEEILKNKTGKVKVQAIEVIEQLKNEEYVKKLNTLSSLDEFESEKESNPDKADLIDQIKYEKIKGQKTDTNGKISEVSKPVDLLERYGQENELLRQHEEKGIARAFRKILENDPEFFQELQHIEAKKADIERRRQEELKNEIWNNSGTKFTGKSFVAKDGNTYTIEESELKSGDKVIKVKDKNGKTVSSAYFTKNEDGTYSIKKGTRVESEIQGIGLASAIYNYFDNNIGKIKRTDTTTDEGDNLWNSNKNRINAKYDAELKALEQQPTPKVEAGSVGVGGDVKLEKGNKIQWNVFGNEESGEWTVGEKTKTRGGKDAVVLTKVYVESSSDGRSYTKEYADANGIKYDNERTVEHIVPLEDLQSLKETPKAGSVGVGGDVEAKKADIERRRQEELKKFGTSEKQTSKNNIKVLGTDEYVSRELMELAYSNDNGNNPEIGGGGQSLDRIIERGGYSKEELLQLLKPEIDKINAKYDAELKALEQPITSNQSEIEAKKADPNYQYTPNPKFKNLTEHIAKGGTVESYVNSLDPETLKDKIDDPIFQRAIDNFNGKNKETTEGTQKEPEEQKEEEGPVSTIPVEPIPVVNTPVETGPPDNSTSLLTGGTNFSEVLKQHGFVDIEVWENNAPTGIILTLSNAEVDTLFHSSKVKELTKLAKNKNPNLSDNLTFKKRAVNVYAEHDNKDTVHVVNNVLQPGDKIYYKIAAKGYNEDPSLNEGNFGVYMVAYVLNDTVVEKGTPNAKEVIVGHIRSNGNPQSKDIDKILRKSLFDKWDKKTDFISEPVPVKGIKKKASLHVGKLRPVTREDIINNEFDVVITDFEKTTSAIENYKFANSRFSPKASADGKGSVLNFVTRQLGKVFMFLPSVDEGGKEAFIPVELETKKVKEVTSYKKKLVNALNDIANAPVDQVNDVVRKKWAQIIGISKGERGILRYRTPDSSFDKENKTDINPDGGLGPVITYYTPSGIDYLTKQGYENASKLLPGFAISTKTKAGYTIEYGLSVDQVVDKLGEVRVHVPSHNTKDFLLDHPELVSTDLKTIDEGYYEQAEVYIDVERPSTKENVINENVKEVLDRLSLLEEKTLELNATETEYVNEEDPSDAYDRISHLESNLTGVPKPELTESGQRSANRGTVIDTLFRKMISREITSFDQFVKEYNSHPKKLLTSNFSEKFLKELYPILTTRMNLLEKNFELRSDIRTLWGEINGVKYAGTIDILAISKKDGKVYIIDLKTSVNDSRTDVNHAFYNKQRTSDSFQQSGYASLFTQRTGLSVAGTFILPIKTVLDRTKDEYVSAPSVKTSNNSFIIELPYIKSIYDYNVNIKKEQTTQTKTAGQKLSDEETSKLESELENIEVPDFKYTDEVTSVEEFKEGAAEKYIKDRFENLGVKVSDGALEIISNIYNVGDGKVWGAFHNAVVYLASDAGLNVGKHEAFHVVFNLFTTKKQREEILTEAYKKYGKEMAISKKEFEEELNKPVDSSKFKVEDQVDYTLTTINNIQNNIDKVVKWYGTKGLDFWNKIQQDLKIPKQQVELLKELHGNLLNKARIGIPSNKEFIEELLIDFAANYKYVVEVNTAKDNKGFTNDNTNYYNQFQDNGQYWLYYIDDSGTYRRTNPDGDSFTIDKDFYDKEFEKNYPNKSKDLYKGESTNSKHYSNLTVPGGTNYTEQEISTPAITPSIKGHAQFATDNGIGWFRSDEQEKKFVEGSKKSRKITDEKLISELNQEGSRTTLIGGIDYVKNMNGEWFTIDREYTQPKTRRILEVQSDLFQKGRDSIDLIASKNGGNRLEAFYDEEGKNYDSYEDYKNDVIKDSQNQFLQLLNKDNNWVTFFIKSIIQDSAKKGYEKVLFPSGNTASKVEGHSTLEEFKKEKQDRIEKLEKGFISTYPGENNVIDKKDTYEEVVEALETAYRLYGKQMSKPITDVIIVSGKEFYKNEINQIKQELERVETEGFGALKPIYNFYENTVTNILNKTYGKDNVKVITDEYGNTWREVDIKTERDLNDIKLKSNEQSFYKKQSILTRLEEKLAEEFENYKATDGFVSEKYKAKYPKLAKFLDSLYNFIYDSYQQLKPYFTNKLSVEDLFYQLDKNIFGRSIFGGRTNAFNKNYSENFARLLHQGKFKVSNIKQIREHAKFIAQNLVHLAVRTFKSNSIKQDGKTINIAQYHTYNSIIESGNKSQFNKEFFNKLPAYVDLWFKKYNSPEQLENYNELKSILENKEDLLKLQLYISQYMNNLYSAGVQITQDANEFDEKTTLIRDTNVNPKTNVKGKIRELMSLIPVRERVLGHYVDKIDPKTGAKVYHNFDVLFNRLLNKLSGSSPEQTMLKLIDLAKTKDYADTLVEKIKNELVARKVLQLGEDINLEKLDKNNKKYDPEYAYKLSASKWFKNLYLITGSQRNIVFINTERSRRGVRVHNSSRHGLGKTFKKHAEIMFLNKEFDSLEFSEISQILESTVTNNKLLNAVDIERIYTFLGYNIDQDISTEMENDQFSNQSLINSAISVFNAIKEGKNPFSVIESKATKQQITEISNLLAKHDQQSYVMNIMTVEGESEYIHQMNNHLTMLINKFKESPKSALAKIKNKILHKDLPIYDALLSKSIEMFEPQYDNGISTKGTYNGITYNKYFNYDLITQQLNYALERMYNTNGKEIVVALPPFSDATSSGYMNVPVVSLDDVVNKLAKTAHAELNRIIYLEDNKTNYRNFDINGKNFILLPFLNSKKNEIIELYKKNGSVELGPELQERLESLISRVLNKKFEIYTEKLIKDGVITKEGSKLVKVDDIIDDSSSNFKDDLQGDIKTQYFNQYYYNTQLIPLLAGDPAFYGTYKSDNSDFDYKNSLLVDFLKRFKEAHSPKQHALFTYKDGTPRRKRRLIVDDISIPTNELESLEKDFPELAGDFSKGHNITDAQTINSIDFTVDVMRGFDEISESEIETAERIKNGEAAEFVFPVLKPYYFDQEESGELLKPLQEKNSEYTLTPAMAWLTKDFKIEKPTSKSDFEKYRRPFLAKILYLFHEHGIDGIGFQSTSKVDRDNSKVITRDVIDNLDMDTILASVVETSMEGYGRQNIVPSEKHFEGKIGEGSQFKVIMGSNLEEDIELEGYGVLTPDAVRSLLDKTHIEDINENRVSLNEALKDTDSLRNTLLAQASEQGKPLSVIESLSKHQDGDLNIPLNFPLTMDDNLKLINSKTKKALNNKVPGSPFVNASSVGFTDLKDYQDNLEIHYKIDSKGKKVIDYIDAAVPAYNYALALLADDRGLLDFKRVEQALGKEATDELRKAFGYRIPTEGKYSIYPIKIKYIIPSYSDSLIILPKEATTITGLDFDIDKLYVLFKAFDLTKGDFSYVVDELNDFFSDQQVINEETGDIVPVTYDNSSAKYLFNKLLNRGLADNIIEEAALNFLREPERFRRIKDNITISNIEMVAPGMETPMARHNLRMSIYEKIGQTRNFAEEFHKGGNADMLRNQIKAFEDKGIALEDQSVPMDISDPIYQLYAANKAIVGGEIIGIAASHNKHHSVVQNIEGLKLTKPFTFLQHTYSSLTKMKDRNGKFISDALASILFASTEHIKNPLMDKLNIDRNNVSMVLAALRLGIPFADIMLILNQKVIKDLTVYINTNLDFTTTIPNLIESFAKEKNIDITEFYKQEFDKNPGKSIFERGLSEYNPNTTDIVALVKIKELFKISDELTSAMIATKFDTDAAFGPTLYDNLNKIDRIRVLLKKFFKKEDPIISGIDLIVPHIIINPETGNYEFSKENASLTPLNDTYIQLALDQANNLREHFSFLSPEFEQVRQNLSDFLEIDEFKKSDRKMLDLDIYNMIFQITQFLDKDFIRDVSKRFSELKNRADFKELYNDYLPFLNALKYEQVTKEVLIRRAVSPGREEGEDLSSMWEKMMKDPNEEISSLAKDLGIYSLITSSFRFTIDSFSQWLPVSFYTSTQEGNIIRDVFKNPVSYLQKIMNTMSEKELSERILYTNPFYAKSVDIQNHIEALEEYSESFTNDFNGEVSKSVIPISFRIDETRLDMYINENEILPQYLSATVYYENATLPVLYKKNGAGIYEIQRLNGNPKAFKNFNLKADEVSFYPDFKMKYHKLNSAKTKPEHSVSKAVNNTYKKDDKIKAEEVEISNEEAPELNEDVVEKLEKVIIVNGQKLGLYSNGTIRDEKGVEVVDEKLINMFQVKHGYNPLRKVEYNDLKVYVLTDNRIIDISAKDAGKEILTLPSAGIVKIKNEILRKLNDQLSPSEKVQEYPDDMEIKGPPELNEEDSACGPTREA